MQNKLRVRDKSLGLSFDSAALFLSLPHFTLSLTGTFIPGVNTVLNTRLNTGVDTRVNTGDKT